MKKKKFILIILVLLIAISIVCYQEFYIKVKGSWVRDFLERPEVVSLVLEKTVESSQTSEKQWETTLTKEQTTQLAELLDDTKFKRITSPTISFYDKDRYRLKATNRENHTLLSIESYGGEFIRGYSADGTGEVTSFKLRIENDSWKEVLESFKPKVK